jgi:hypothetical protein
VNRRGDENTRGKGRTEREELRRSKKEDTLGRNVL